MECIIIFQFPGFNFMIFSPSFWQLTAQFLTKKMSINRWQVEFWDDSSNIKLEYLNPMWIDGTNQIMKMLWACWVLKGQSCFDSRWPRWHWQTAQLSAWINSPAIRRNDPALHQACNSMNSSSLIFRAIDFKLPRIVDLFNSFHRT